MEAKIIIDDRDSSVQFSDESDDRWQRWGSQLEYNSTTTLATEKGMSVALNFTGKWHPNSNVICIVVCTGGTPLELAD